MSLEPLPADELRWSADPASFGFETTDEIEPLTELVGQDRALDALEFGIAVEAPGFNVFILGEEGSGRRTAALSQMRKRAETEFGPDDWCYINNFDDPRRPRALRLPSGMSRRLAEDVEGLITRLATELPRILGSEEYQAQRKALLDQLEARRKQFFQHAEEEADRRGLAVIQSPQAIVLAPKRDGQILSETDLAQLSPEERHKYQEARDEVQDLFEEALRKLGEAATEAQEALREVNRRTIEATVTVLFRAPRARYSELPQVIEFLDAAQRDLVRMVNRLAMLTELESELLPRTLASEEFQRRYSVNVLVSHDHRGAPVIEEHNPTFSNLLGRIEHRVLQGALVTDFTMIRAGSLLRANGGYLLVDAMELLRRPLAWDALKRALKQGRLKIEEPGAELGIISTISLDPESIPLSVKVILIGPPILYYLLFGLDPDFAEIFKVKADFAPTIPRTPEAEREYARLAEARRRAESLPVFEASAIAALVEHGSRRAGDRTRLTARLSEIDDLIREAGFRARQAGSERVGRDHVQKAIAEWRRRSNRLEEELFRQIEMGVIIVRTEGTAIGQVNGLSVLTLGDYPFARPIRVSASTAMGARGVVDIEREAKLGGPIHSKAVLILGGYLNHRYGGERPLVLTATLAFEQVYEMIEGDSASLAELLALLSSLAGVPIRQDIAVTGSVNQAGEVQPVGGVTEKVEGYYHACRIKGLTGSQAVILPRRNVQHLMLDLEVVEAAKAGRFAIYAVDDVDEAIALAFGRPAEEVHRAVRSRLDSYVAEWQRLSAQIAPAPGAIAPPTPPRSGGADGPEA